MRNVTNEFGVHSDAASERKCTSQVECGSAASVKEISARIDPSIISELAEIDDGQHLPSKGERGPNHRAAHYSILPGPRIEFPFASVSWSPNISRARPASACKRATILECSPITLRDSAGSLFKSNSDISSSAWE